MRTIVIIQARMGSTRLPGKVLKDLLGKPVLGWVASACIEAYGVDDVWIATSTLAEDDAIYQWQHDIPYLSCYRGEPLDVLARYTACARLALPEPGIVVRVTGDCPLLDPRVLSETIALQRVTKLPYASNVDPPTWPDGLDVQVMTSEALYRAHEFAIRPSDRETVCEFIGRNKDLFPSVNLTCPLPELGRERWVVDTQDDLDFVTALLKKCKRSASSFAPPSYIELLDVLEQNPGLREINRKWRRNERFFAQIAEETP